MDDPTPKKKNNLLVLAGVLIIGGSFVSSRARSLEELYPTTSGTPLGLIFAGVLIGAGIIALVVELAGRNKEKKEKKD